MADGEVKGEDEILIGIDQRMANRKDPLQKEIEVMSLGMIEGSKDASDVDKRGTSKETAWQRTFICTKRKKQKKM